MKKIKFTKEKFPIAIILVLSAVLNFANLTIEGYGNEYYAAGVKSMLINFKNFFFVSFDPSGFVSIDKPPLGFWIQTISAKIFGFSGWSIMFPQALAGVISVGLIYYIVKKSFGNTAGTISALCLAVTPVFVAASRNNTIDNLLVMMLLIACVFLSKAAEKGRFKYLIISLVFVGIGFNIKMLQAYMIVPAVYVTYLISSAVPVKQRIKHLVAGTVVLAVVSLSWAVIVDLVPAQYRPYVGSSTNNTVMELIVGHNGVERFNNSGMGGMGGRQASGEFRNRNDNIYGRQNQNGNWANRQNAARGSQNGNMPNFPGGNGNIPEGMKLSEGQMPGGRGGQGAMAGNFGGQTESGITRLFSKNILSDQIVWFLPLAIFGFIAGAIVEKLKFPFDNRKKLDLILWIFWLVPEFLYFSYTKGLFHQYYLTMMAPPIAALSGIGITSMWKLYKEKSMNIRWILLPISLIVDGLVQLLMLSYYSNISSAIKTVVVSSLVLCFASSVLLIIYKIVKKGNLEQAWNIKLGKALTALAFIGVLITPAIGSAATIKYKMNGTMPSAGLELLSNNQSNNFMMGGRGPEGSGNNDKLIKFLEKNTTDEKYILVVSNATSAENIVLQTGKGVMALGGFMGSDKIITLDKFKELVKNGQVRYVLTGGMGRGSMDDIMNWVEKNGKVVPESQWRESNSSNSETMDSKIQNSNNEDNKVSNNGQNENLQQNRSNGFGGMNSEVLYDLKGSVK
ncbi:glycosyltransferase family 39 protein [Clostridium sp. WILCCON 0269]|uniref:Glycosyltransferase family 39 protein n=1 Tax=Candidatus Clostridium eludens TaxID=3381663 RepID=A0ABW8SFD0_9CLOT